jgi:hypothetical protein
MDAEKNFAESSNLCDGMIAYPPSNVLKDTPRSSALARIDFRGARGNSFLSFSSLSWQQAQLFRKSPQLVQLSISRLQNLVFKALL